MHSEDSGLTQFCQRLIHFTKHNYIHIVRSFWKETSSNTKFLRKSNVAIIFCRLITQSGFSRRRPYNRTPFHFSYFDRMCNLIVSTTTVGYLSQYVN